MICLSFSEKHSSADFPIYFGHMNVMVSQITSNSTICSKTWPGQQKRNIKVSNYWSFGRRFHLLLCVMTSPFSVIFVIFAPFKHSTHHRLHSSVYLLTILTCLYKLNNYGIWQHSYEYSMFTLTQLATQCTFATFLYLRNCFSFFHSNM